MPLNKLYIFIATLACAGSLSCTTAEYENQLQNQSPEAAAVSDGALDDPSVAGDQANDSDERKAGAFEGFDTSFGENPEENEATIPPEEIEPEVEVGSDPIASATETNIGFRVSQFGIMSPPLCVMSEDNSSCDNVDMMVNDTFDAMLNDHATPMDLLGVFDSLPLEDTSQISFGTASCIREEGEIISCAPIGPADFSFLSISEEEECIVGTDGMEKVLAPPCFVTEAKDIQIFMQGMLIGLLEAQIMGTLEESEDGYGISGGFITGFVPESMAQTWMFSTADSEDEGKVSFDQLFHRTACHPNEEGDMGWNLVLGFSGSAVAVDAP